MLISFSTAVDPQPAAPGGDVAIEPVSTSMAGLAMGQLAIAVLGVLAISSEYSSGGIRTSFIAVPRRGRLIVAKVLVLFPVALAVGTAACVTSFLVGQRLLSSTGVSASLDDPGVLRAVLGGGLYLAASALLGFALGALFKHSAGSIAAAVAALIVLPPLTQLLPSAWGKTVSKWFTTNAGQQIALVDPGSGAGPWTGYLAFILYSVAILAVAVALLRTRDA